MGLPKVTTQLRGVQEFVEEAVWACGWQEGL